MANSHKNSLQNLQYTVLCLLLNMAKKEGHKTSKDNRWVDGVSVFSLPHKKSRTGFVQGIKLRKFYIDRKGETNCTTGLVIESLFELVPVGCGTPAVLDPTAQ